MVKDIKVLEILNGLGKALGVRKKDGELAHARINHWSAWLDKQQEWIGVLEEKVILLLFLFVLQEN